MITKAHIEKSLKALNREFIQSKKLDPQYFCKLATLELCGWIEISMDDILLSTANRLIKDVKEVARFEKEVVRRNSGFQYEWHFKNMAVHLVGVVGWKKLENKINRTKLVTLKIELENLKNIRDSLAHTYMDGKRPSIDAPSVQIVRYNKIYIGLKDVEYHFRHSI